MNYSKEKNILLLLSLLKAYGIKRVVASPGGTNLSLVASMQSDPYFEMYSCVDERSAAYLACGIAEESGEPVVISCTGATAARNYMSALTEAYYRKLPIVAITSSRKVNHVGHLYAQMTDRSVQPKDIIVRSELIQEIITADDEWDCNIKVNKALSELYRHGGGPVHLNVETSVSKEYGVAELPVANKIERYFWGQELPNIDARSIAIYIGSHLMFTETEIDAIDSFCAKYNASVYCDHGSNYKGRNRILTSLIGMQTNLRVSPLDVDLLIHIGEVSGGYDAQRFQKKEVWRVNPDGEMRDLFGCLSKVFEMSERDFFLSYSCGVKPAKSKRSELLQTYYNSLYHKIPDLPFSNLWIAKELASFIPDHSVLHLGILNSLRSWNCFEIPFSVLSFSNTGGFGIDGCMSSIVGASLVNRGKLYFICLGDLSFFYDMNVLGCRHIGNNLRILMINNGHGQEFHNYSSPGSAFGQETDCYIAAGGHYGNKSRTLVRHFAQDLGFRYLSASSKDEFISIKAEFLSKDSAQSIILEAFTDGKDESEALRSIGRIVNESEFDTVNAAKIILSKIMGNRTIAKIKGIING